MDLGYRPSRSPSSGKAFTTPAIRCEVKTAFTVSCDEFPSLVLMKRRAAFLEKNVVGFEL